MAKTVLIVEDERAIVEILKFNLKREGYETLEALDGEKIHSISPVVAIVNAVGKAPQAAHDRIAKRPLVFNNQNAHTGLLAQTSPLLTRIL